MLGKLKHTCLVTGCTNSNEVGTGMLIDANNPDEKEHVFGFICSPCWKAVITGKCRNSKLSENIAKTLGISIDECRSMLTRLGDAGVKGAEAGKQLGIAFRKLKEKQNANRT